MEKSWFEWGHSCNELGLHMGKENKMNMYNQRSIKWRLFSFWIWYYVLIYSWFWKSEFELSLFECIVCEWEPDKGDEIGECFNRVFGIFNLSNYEWPLNESYELNRNYKPIFGDYVIVRCVGRCIFKKHDALCESAPMLFTLDYILMLS